MAKPVDDKEMSFIDHLEELRWHLIRSLLAILVFTVVAFIYKDFFFGKIVLGPARLDFWTYRKLCELGQLIDSPALCFDKLNFTLQSRKMAGQFLMHLTSSFVIGLIIAFPYVFWELWRFVRPGLYENERRVTTGVVLVVSLLFLTGSLFGYYILTPISVQFLANYTLDPSIVNEFDIISYVSTLLTLVLGCALLFQLPMLVYFLAKAGIVDAQSMRIYRRHAIVVIFVVAAIITPADVFSQIIVALPLILLYEISIFIAGFVKKKEERQEALQKRDA
ncbi:sec-independent protein translocase protein TatC [Thermonema lapsum]|uniref:Sec-independent protein translocase protein TatC n=1 Tax=Thermonema lapsum TaxID=28195 RepID=A0A846MT91_9BACT|nr:twin-arginine translocase subunit TatC [Thermonema lapsum]NIK74447.1 sec-independent protein translocase protein TatC [Thermonema lapsum]